MSPLFQTCVWWLGCAWAYYELKGHKNIFTPLNLRWLRAGLSGVFAAAMVVSFFPQWQKSASEFMSLASVAFAASLRLKLPQRWMKVPPLLRTFIYSIGFFCFFCVLVPHELYKFSQPHVFQTSKLWVAILTASACVLIIPCFLQFAREGATPEPLDSPTRLIEGGWYAICEHPIMYGEILAIFAGVAAFPSSWGLLYATTAAITLRGVWAPFEERYLRPQKLNGFAT